LSKPIDKKGFYCYIVFVNVS